jgi:hypothetical protein
MFSPFCLAAGKPNPRRGHVTEPRSMALASNRPVVPFDSQAPVCNEPVWRLTVDVTAPKVEAQLR